MDAEGYRIEKLDFESDNLRLQRTAGQKGKLARKAVRLAGALILLVVARGHDQIIVNFFLAFPSLPSLAPWVCGHVLFAVEAF